MKGECIEVGAWRVLLGKIKTAREPGSNDLRPAVAGLCSARMDGIADTVRPLCAGTCGTEGGGAQARSSPTSRLRTKGLQSKYPFESQIGEKGTAAIGIQYQSHTHPDVLCCGADRGCGRTHGRCFFGSSRFFYFERGFLSAKGRFIGEKSRFISGKRGCFRSSSIFIFPLEPSLHVDAKQQRL